MANKFIKKYSTFYSTQEMQIKTSLRVYLTSVKKFSIRKTNNKCWQEYTEKGTLIVGRNAN
jgi:hypothetical protein